MEVYISTEIIEIRIFKFTKQKRGSTVMILRKRLMKKHCHHNNYDLTFQPTKDRDAKKSRNINSYKRKRASVLEIFCSQPVTIKQIAISIS